MCKLAIKDFSWQHWFYYYSKQFIVLNTIRITEYSWFSPYDRVPISLSFILFRFDWH